MSIKVAINEHNGNSSMQLLPLKCATQRKPHAYAEAGNKIFCTKISSTHFIYIARMFDWQHICVYLFLAAGAAASYLKHKLTLPASLTAVIVGLLVYSGAGLAGLAMLLTFFASGTWATKHQWEKKEALKLAEKRKGTRNSIQVLANGGVAAASGILIIIDKSYQHLYTLMMAASLASACADTLSSELGNVYGKKHVNILTLKREERGPDGVVSMEGLIAGAAGSLLISIVYAGFYGWSVAVLSILLSGVAGNLFDSLLGATLQRRQLLSNDMVNVLNTFFAALFILLFERF